jgi:hypothetical protein
MKSAKMALLCISWMSVQSAVSAAPAPTITAPPPLQSANVDPARKAAAVDLAKAILNPDAQREQLTNVVSYSVDQMMASNDGLKLLNTQYPDMRAELKAAWKPIFLRQSDALMPGFIDEVAALYAAHLDVSELKEVAVFWRAPTGQKFQQSISSNMKNDTSIKEIITQAATEGAEFKGASTTSIDKDKKQAVALGMAKTSAADQALIMRYAMSPAGRKVIALNAERSKIDAKWFNASTPEAIAELQETTPRIVTQHMARVDAERAKKK